MRWNKKYDYPTSSRATEDGIRRYVLGEAKLPSVTSILDVTKSEEDKAALANWRERTGHKEAEAITKAASSCLLYTSPSPRDRTRSRMPSSA